MLNLTYKYCKCNTISIQYKYGKVLQGSFIMAKKYTREEIKLIKELIDEGLTNRQIADRLGRTYNAISVYVRKHKLRANFKGVNMTCKNCGQCFTATHNLHSREYCSDNCRTNHYVGTEIQCRNCLIFFYSKEKKRKYCSIECSNDWIRKHGTRSIVSYVVYRFDCKVCGKRCNEVGRRRRKYCSKRCEDKYWATEYQSKKVLMNTMNVRCKECSKYFTTHVKSRRFCSKSCGNKYHWRKKDILRRMRIKDNGAIDYCISLERLHKRDKGICHICKNKVDMNLNTNDDMYGSIDHVIPLAKGGTHTWDNIKLSHRICNSIKGAEVL